MSDSPGPAPLNCLRGNAAPDDLIKEFATLADLKASARDAFWQVLTQYLQPEFDAAAERTVTSFCGQHEVSIDDLAPAIRSSRVIFQQAARRNLNSEAFEADIRGLVDADAAEILVPLLVPWYAELAPQLRRGLAQQTIADHGKLLLESNWRLDRITSSNRCDELDVPVAVVTLRYRQGTETQQITLQLLPDELNQLRDAASEMLA